MFSLSFIWSCLLFTAEKAASPNWQVSNNKGASSCSVWISSRSALEEINTYTRRGDWSRNFVGDGINTRLVVKNYPVVLSTIKVWQNICACLPLGNKVVDLFFNHFPKHEQNRWFFSCISRSNYVLEKNEKKCFGSTEVIMPSTDFSGSSLDAASSEVVFHVSGVLKIMIVVVFKFTRIWSRYFDPNSLFMKRRSLTEL